MPDNTRGRGSKKENERKPRGVKDLPKKKKAAPVKSAKRAVKRYAKKQTKKAVRRSGKKLMSAGQALFRGITKGPKERTWYRQVSDLVKSFGVEGAAERLGVKPATVKAWTHKDREKRRKPGTAAQQKIREQLDTREARRRMISRKRDQELRRMSTQGATVKMQGYIGPSALSDSGRRWRTFQDFNLPPEHADRVIQAFIDGGPENASRVMQEVMGELYFGTAAGKQASAPAWFGSFVDFDMNPLPDPK